MVQEYTSAVKKYGSGNTVLLASVTTPSKIFPLFQDVICYFRSALTPVSLFATMPNQVLNNEGPQTVNTGVAFAYSMNASAIILVGCDLGVADINKQRSQDAIGESPRQFDLSVKGNKRAEVYTNSTLLDGAKVLEHIKKAYPDRIVKQLNASDGIYIEGWEPIDINQIRFFPGAEDYANKSEHSSNNLVPQANKAIVVEWRSSLPRFNKDRFRSLWKTSRVRYHTSQKVDELIAFLASGHPWDPWVICQIHKAMRIDKGQRFGQVGSRIIRGQVLKLLLAIQRQLIVMAEDQEARASFEKAARKLFIDQLIMLKKQVFALYDLIEADIM